MKLDVKGLDRKERYHKLENLVEWTRTAPPKKKKTNTKDRNLLSKLPSNESELNEALYECFLMARRGKRNTMDEFKYEAFWEENQEIIFKSIVSRTWRPGSSKKFVTHTPVDREIFAAWFRDRIIHHFLYAIVAPWWDKRFIYDSYSCRRGKGTDFGIKRMQGMMVAALTGGESGSGSGAKQEGTWVTSPNGRKAYVIKCDLSSYFMSLPRRTLYKKVLWGLKKQFPEGGWLFETAKFLWHEVIFDDPCINARMAGKASDWECLPWNKILANWPKGYGIVIGNLTSQLLSNIMLNEFDWWMKRTMGFKWYGRYVDDFFVIVEGKDYEWAKYAIDHVVPGRLKKMGLTMHPRKCYRQEVRKGCSFLGKKVTPYVILPGERYLKNMRAAFIGYVDGKVEYETVQSYVGMARHMAAYKEMRKVLDKIRI